MKTVEISSKLDLQTFLSDFYDKIVYDGSPKFKDYIPTGIWFTLHENECIAGFINLEPLNNVTYISHVMIYEMFRGNGSEEWGIQVADFMRKNLGDIKFLAITPYISAKKYAERMGFKYLCTLTNSIKKNGVLLDQYMLEMQ